MNAEKVPSKGGTTTHARRPQKLTWEAVVEIRQAGAAGEMQVALARRYGVTQSLVSRILSGARRTVRA